jgi:hypothetical protein
MFSLPIIAGAGVLGCSQPCGLRYDVPFLTAMDDGDLLCPIIYRWRGITANVWVNLFLHFILFYFIPPRSKGRAARSGDVRDGS